MKYQIIFESEDKESLEYLRETAYDKVPDFGEPTVEQLDNMIAIAGSTHISRNEILYVLQTMDLEMKYDEHLDETGAYDALSPTAKEELFRLVKKGLEFGLGEVWNDYMDAAISEAIQYRQID